MLYNNLGLAVTLVRANGVKELGDKEGILCMLPLDCLERYGLMRGQMSSSTTLRRSLRQGGLKEGAF